MVGGGDAALDEGLFAARFALKVMILHRRKAFRASAILQERVFAEPRIEVAWSTVVERINGADHVESVTLRDVVTDAARQLVSAAGDGATAAIRADHYLAGGAGRGDEAAATSGTPG